MAVGNVLVTPLLIEFRKRNRDARISLELSGVESALAGLARGRYDFCVVATDAVLDANSFHSELVARPPFALLASVNNLTVPDELEPSGLGELNYVCPLAEQAIRRSQDFALASIGVYNRKVVIELGSGETIKQAVAADLGVAFLWRATAAVELAAGTLREVTVRGADLRDKLYIVQRVDHSLTPLQARLLSSVRAGLHEVLGAPVL